MHSRAAIRPWSLLVALGGALALSAPSPEVRAEGPDAAAEGSSAEEPETTPAADEATGDAAPVPDVAGLEARPKVAPDEVVRRASAARKKELSSTAYRFCHDPDFGRQGTEGRELCSIFDATSDDVCPEARQHCKDWRAPRDGGKHPSSFGAGGAKGGERGRGRPDLLDEPAWALPTLPPALSWAIIGLFGALALAWFVRALRGAGFTRGEAEAEASLTEAERRLQALPEARSAALLRLAERAFARGDDAETAVVLHLAVLRHLDDAGLARYHPAKTNGDYLRSLRAQPALATYFRGVAAETERLRFGDGGTDHQRLAQLLAAARATLGLSAGGGEPDAPHAGPATLAVLLCLASSHLACAPSGSDRPYLVRGPAGLAALPELLRASGLEVEVSRARLGALPPDVGVVVLRTSAVRGEGWPAALRLDATLDRDVSVVILDDQWEATAVLPMTATVAPPLRAVDLRTQAPSPEVYCTWRLAELGALSGAEGGAVRVPTGRRLAPLPGTTTATVTAKPIRFAPVLEWAEARPLADGTAAAVAWAADRVEHGTSLAGCTYVFADRDLFTNASLARAPNARWVAGFFATLARDGRRIVLLDRLESGGAAQGAGGDGADEPEPESPARPLRASNLLPFIAQAAALLVAFFLSVGVAFGPLRDPVAREHKSFVEHVEAIGRQYARTGADGLAHAARSLARLLVVRHRERVRGSGAESGWSGVAEHLARQHALDEDHVRAALRLGLDGASDLGPSEARDPAPSSERMLRTLSRLLGGREPPRKPPPGRARGSSALDDQSKDRTAGP